MHQVIAKNKLLKPLEGLQGGCITFKLPNNEVHTYGDSIKHKPIIVEVYDWKVITNLLLRGNIGLAEDYSASKWTTTDLPALLTLGLKNKKLLARKTKGSFLFRLLVLINYLFRANTLKGSRKNIVAHYDLGNKFYELWLDPSMTYSSALFKKTDETLEEAQANKYDRIIDRLKAKGGNSLLEIGCGWGGFAEQALKKHPLRIKGLTLSDEQHAYATKRLGDKAQIALEDYRTQTGKYDHIVSIEMFEAVGEQYWPVYFKQVSKLLKPSGNAVIQTITINDNDFKGYRKRGDFIRSFIFPGGMLPSPSRFIDAASKAGLKATDSYSFGLDYAKTLEAWLDRFDAKKHEVLNLGFDEEFIRMWRFYLAGCIAGFKSQHIDVMQIEFQHSSIQPG